ncbi:hypothetical protein DAPPUDRAFT_331982 [Daphnia pulex]|uniref:Chromo domain-containing protein n=1 Tax=Daphnia pulex TaxID=6669 RepID=E9HNX9_DAPPU|nr:hypothetical protein DAPPUDRAFT_331982 [Daphnia pulex]|eukprot:EFX66554.1 hypothetical protein DAPPUDRAFT_331982 [Daphnia pulex]
MAAPVVPSSPKKCRDTTNLKKNRKNISEDYPATKPYKFDSILDQELLLADRNQPVYLIKWENFDDSYNSWEPESFFKNQQGILAKFQTILREWWGPPQDCHGGNGGSPI